MEGTVTISMETVQKVVAALMQDPKVAAFDALNQDFIMDQQQKAEEVPVIVSDDEGNITESTLDDHAVIVDGH